MKKVLYETGAGESPFDCKVVGRYGPNVIRGLEEEGCHVTITKDVPDEPKIERCEIAVHPISKTLVYHGGGEIGGATGMSVDLWKAISNPDFAGFEFADGSVEANPWKLQQRRGDIITTPRGFKAVASDTIIEHAKYVLFRSGK